MEKKVNIDIIILSYAKDEYLKGLTVQTIETLLASEDTEKIHFNVLVIESNKKLQPYQYENSTTIYPNEKFGFNKYLNLGINATCNKYLCLCNNDLIFEKEWASIMLNFTNNFKDDLIVTSPFCNKMHIDFLNSKQPIKGYFGYFAGYCFFTTRETLKLIGKLDEKINFWFADLDFIELMEQHKIPHYLVPNSKVYHLSAQATKSLSKRDFLKLTAYPNIYFNYKWKDKSIFKYYYRLTKFVIKYGLLLIEDIFLNRAK